MNHNKPLLKKEVAEYIVSWSEEIKSKK